MVKLSPFEMSVLHSYNLLRALGQEDCLHPGVLITRIFLPVTFIKSEAWRMRDDNHL